LGYFRSIGESDEGSTATSGAPVAKLSRAGTGESVGTGSVADLPAVKWEWLSDSGWTAFDSKNNTAVDKAFRQKKEELEIKVFLFQLGRFMA